MALGFSQPFAGSQEQWCEQPCSSVGCHLLTVESSAGPVHRAFSRVSGHTETELLGEEKGREGKRSFLHGSCIFIRLPSMLAARK